MRLLMRRGLAGVMAAGLIIAACGSDDDDSQPADTEAPSDEMMDEPADEMMDEPADEMTDGGMVSALPLSGEVEVAAGTMLNLDECPDDWDPFQGVDGDEIRIGQSLPKSGQLAAFGAIGDGMQMYFDYVNDTDPIEGKKLTLIQKDDAYEAGRTVANVEEMIDSDDIFMISHLIGTPNNLAARPITDEACVPQVFNSTGFPFWGDPANFPWTVGNILNYVTETEIWCADIKEQVGEDASVAALIMNNDFGTTYSNTLENSDACAGLDIVKMELHDPAGSDVANEMTTLIATDADVLVSATTGVFCSQVAATLAASEWRPVVYNSFTCGNLSSFYASVADAIAELGDSAPRLTNSIKVCGDPAYADDPAIQLIEKVLDEYGDGTTCADGSYSTGVFYGQMVEDLLRSTAELEGGLNRVNLLAALWNSDTSNDNLIGGTLKLDGVNDAYWTESAVVQIIVAGEDGSLSFENRGELADFEGTGGSFAS